MIAGFKHLGLILATMAVGGVMPTALTGQEEAGNPPPPDSVDLKAEREVFEYPVFERRNPFKPLGGGEGEGPRYEQMQLDGIIFSTEPGRSVALLSAGAGTRVTSIGTQDVRGRSRRVRAGDSWGNVRVVEIRRDMIVVDVEEFGLSERREMRLQTRGQGGSR